MRKMSHSFRNETHGMPSFSRKKTDMMVENGRKMRRSLNEKSKIRESFIEYDEKKNENLFLRIIDISL